MTPPPFALQLKVLSTRYRACMMGDIGALVLLIAQAPFIGWLARLSGARRNRHPLFCHVSFWVWFGCINACEIVKEREDG